MSFETNPNVSQRLFEAVCRALRPGDNFVRVSLCGFTGDALERVRAGLATAGLHAHEDSAWEFICVSCPAAADGGDPRANPHVLAQQGLEATSFVQRGGVVTVPFHLSLSDVRPTAVRVIPTGSVELACVTRYENDTDDNLRVVGATFSTGYRVKTTGGFSYAIQVRTPPGTTWAEAETAVENGLRHVYSVSVEILQDGDVGDVPMSYCVANALHLLQSLYDARLGVRFEYC